LFSDPGFTKLFLHELRSWIGRTFRRRRSRIHCTQSPLLLDLGAGANYTKGWIHVDYYRLKFWQKCPPKPDVETDLRFPIHCEDNTADGVYSGHMIEHLYPDEAWRLLQEIYRILKPSCWLRINFPDLETYVDYYVNGEKYPEVKYSSGCDAISNVTQNYGHHSAWDERQMTKALSTIGFIHIKKVEFGKEGTDKRLIKEENARKWATLVIEAQKPE